MASFPSFLQRLFPSRDGGSPTPHTLPLPELILQARLCAQQLRSGPHGNRRAGEGSEFWQFRPHQPGEPAFLIDWKQSARSPEPNLLWVREQEQQAPRPLFIWVDPSPSMRWRSSDTLPEKYETALEDALTLGQAALLGGEETAIPGTRQHFTGRHALPRLAHGLTQLPGQDAAGQGVTFPDLTGVPPHASLIVISDFLWDEAKMQQCLSRVATHPGRTALLAVLDPQEKELPFSGSVHFTSCENEPELTLPATETLHEAYQTRLEAHFHQLNSNSRGHGLPFFRFHLTDQSALPVLAACHHFLGGRA